MSKNNLKGNFTLRPNSSNGIGEIKTIRRKTDNSAKPKKTGNPNPNYTPPASIKKW